MKSFLKVLGGILVGALFLGKMLSGSPVAFLLAGAIALFLFFSARKRKKAETATADSARASAPFVRVSPSRYIGAAKFLEAPPSCYVAFDLETTGLSAQQDAIIEIGAVYVEDGRVVRSFSQLVNPGRPIPEAASNVNHITDKMVKHCPKIGPVLQDFIDFIKGASVLAAHNASFDAGFLLTAAAREGVQIAPKFFDTLKLSCMLWPNLSNHKLGTVCKKIRYTPKEAHRAEADALAVHEIIQAALRSRTKRKG